MSDESICRDYLVITVCSERETSSKLFKSLVDAEVFADQQTRDRAFLCRADIYAYAGCCYVSSFGDDREIH